jgi:hypothetical protein
MKRLLKSVAALLAGWGAAAMVLYLGVLLLELVGLSGVGASYLNSEASNWIILAVFVAGAAASPVVGCRIFEKVARRLGVARELVGRPGWPRKVAAYAAGVSTAVLVAFVTLLPLIVANLRNWDGPIPLMWAWFLGMFPAMPYFALLATRVVLRGGRGAEPGTPAAGAAPAAATPPAPEAPEPPLLRIAPA